MKFHFKIIITIYNKPDFSHVVQIISLAEDAQLDQEDLVY